jgi:hypothetical protein
VELSIQKGKLDDAKDYVVSRDDTAGIGGVFRV